MRTLRTLLGVGLLAVAATAGASVVIPLSVEQLSQKAAVIVHGRVLSQHVDSTRGGRIVTTTTLAVVEALKGQPGATVEVRTLGGILNGMGQQVSGEVRFAANEEVVVFLSPTRLHDASYAVIGLAQGKFSITGGKSAAQDLSGLGFAERAGAPVADRVAVPVALDELEARIARVVAP